MAVENVPIRKRENHVICAQSECFEVGQYSP